MRWFTTGNVPVKVGVVLSVFGVGFLVKEGIDGSGSSCRSSSAYCSSRCSASGCSRSVGGCASSNRTYALSVQGGGIAVLYLTIYASFALYALLPAVLAFALLIVVTAAASALAVLQDARALAVLGIIGGFLAPVLTSSGSGNHVALFGYYAMLEPRDPRHRVVQGVARAERARLLCSRSASARSGASTATRPSKFATTEPFLVLFTRCTS